jgi:HK97 family phage prohead protease
MHYFVTDISADCPAWATVKEDGEVLACHATEQEAIDQMVAVSLSEGIEPGGKLEPRNDNNDDLQGVQQMVKDEEMFDNSRGKVQERETRTAHGTIEVREEAEGMVFEGYAAVFNSPSEPLPFIERIERGAFTRSLKTRNDVKLLWNHDSSLVVGSTRAKTLTLVEDDRGLRVSGVLPNTTAGRDAAELLRRGDVDAMSFGFTTIKDSWNAEGTERTLKAVRLFEVSIVGNPAYTATAGTTSVRNLERVAERAQVDADALSAALEKVEAGEDITADERTLLSSVLDKLAPEPEIVDETPVADMAMLELKKKKLQLLQGF